MRKNTDPEPLETMWMTDYLRAVKRGFRDQHGMKPDGGTEEDPTFSHIPDGIYPMEIDDKTDRVEIIGGLIYCCRFDEGKPEPCPSR
jgi:hypothetical protein